MDSSTFNQIIVLKNIDHFSAVEIRTAYLSIKRDEGLDPTSVRRFVYEELLKLVKRGWLKKRTSVKKGVTRYIKTNLFEPDYFKKLVTLGDDGSMKTNELSYEQTLTNRLKQYNSELLEGLGAVKEYVALKNIHPERHAALKQRYVAVKENNQVLKGKISALNELMKSNKET
ncbi:MULTISPECIES: hypothetical protein [unclassified Pseudoalteromonas]|uniref:hypothetical protein n=1 Tax=unclassified Pseudoalteromonas TaxID=194690 RepID=UPI0005A99818|nr:MULTISPECIES: hypothetical protein [unclassified Pseudoalteromonas]